MAMPELDSLVRVPMICRVTASLKIKTTAQMCR
jgi:hypothetical protein